MARKNTNSIQRMLQVPEATWLISTDDIRDMWLDYSDLQEVFGNIIEEKDPEGYAKCVARPIIRFNGRLPQTNFNAANFPDDGLLLDLAFEEVLKTVEAYHTANFISVSGGGVNTPLHERFQAIKMLRQELTQSNEQRVKEWKVYISNQQTWGSFNSDDLGGNW